MQSGSTRTIAILRTRLAIALQGTAEPVLLHVSHCRAGLATCIALQSRSCYRTAEPVLQSHCRAGLAIALQSRSWTTQKEPGVFQLFVHRAKSPPRASLCNQIGLDLGITAVGWDLAESIKRSASDRLGDLVPQRVRARTFQSI